MNPSIQDLVEQCLEGLENVKSQQLNNDELEVVKKIRADLENFKKNPGEATYQEVRDGYHSSHKYREENEGSFWDKSVVVRGKSVILSNLMTDLIEEVGKFFAESDWTHDSSR